MPLLMRVGVFLGTLAAGPGADGNRLRLLHVLRCEVSRQH